MNRYLQERKGRWYFRIRVPKMLQEMGGIPEVITIRSTPGQFYAAGVFFNVEVPEMQQALSLSADTSAEGGVGCQDRANAQSQLLLPG